MGKLSILIIYTLYYLFIVVVPTVKLNQKESNLKLQFFDVGQGDATLITTPNNKRILVDGGPSSEVDRYLFYEMPINCHLDYIILTHPHFDHLAGLNRVMERCSVSVILFNDIYYESAEYKKWILNVAQRPNLTFLSARNNDVFYVDGITLYVLWPDSFFTNNKNMNINDSSIVLLVDYNDLEILLPGDVQAEVFKKIDIPKIRSIVDDGQLEIYKASHHGAKNALYKSFFESLRTKYVVVSSGKLNKYGHPHKEVLEFFSNLKSVIYRTDIDGTVEFNAL